MLIALLKQGIIKGISSQKKYQTFFANAVNESKFSQNNF